MTLKEVVDLYWLCQEAEKHYSESTSAKALASGLADQFHDMMKMLRKQPPADRTEELERWKSATGEYYQTKERHRETLEKIRRVLNDPLLSDTAKVIRAQAALTGRDA